MIFWVLLLILCVLAYIAGTLASIRDILRERRGPIAGDNRD